MELTDAELFKVLEDWPCSISRCYDRAGRPSAWVTRLQNEKLA